MKFNPIDGQKYVTIVFNKASLWTMRTFTAGEPASELHSKLGLCYQPTDKGRAAAFKDAKKMLGIENE